MGAQHCLLNIPRQGRTDREYCKMLFFFSDPLVTLTLFCWLDFVTDQGATELLCKNICMLLMPYNQFHFISSTLLSNHKTILNYQNEQSTLTSAAIMPLISISFLIFGTNNDNIVSLFQHFKNDHTEILSRNTKTSSFLFDFFFS